MVDLTAHQMVQLKDKKLVKKLADKMVMKKAVMME